MINANQLARIYPNSGSNRRALCLPGIQQAISLAHAGETINRTAGLLATVDVETGSLKWLVEIGNAAYFARYDGRADLGNTQPGDGYKYRGRGYPMITGRGNYGRAETELGLPLLKRPGLAADPLVSGRILAWYWSTRDVNELCDLGHWQQVRQAVNGGTNGLDVFLATVKRALAVLGGK